MFSGDLTPLARYAQKATSSATSAMPARLAAEPAWSGHDHLKARLFSSSPGAAPVLEGAARAGPGWRTPEECLAFSSGDRARQDLHEGGTTAVRKYAFSCKPIG